MSSPALDAFNTWVDGTNLSTANKATAKAQGATLYNGAVTEQLAWVAARLDELLATATGEDLTRYTALKNAVLDILNAPNFNPAKFLASYLRSNTDIEMRWAKALAYLFRSSTMAEAQVRFEDLLARFDSAALRTRLKRLSDLITNELGA